MAVAITRHFAATRPSDSLQIEADSAGTGAHAGHNATKEAFSALAGLGIDASDHRSKPLTKELIEWADHVFAMTSSHVAVASALAPEQRGKISMLDPSGLGVPDPIGGSQAVYDEVCRRLADLIAHRLKEMDL